jgi:C4-dicarboxylate-specific signal transduction histidine kinase
MPGPRPLKTAVAIAAALGTLAPAACIAIGLHNGWWWLDAVGVLGALGLGAAAATAFAREDAPAPPAPPRDEALATLAAGLAHELGQPLSAARVGIEGLHYLRQLGREPSPEHSARTLGQVGMSLIAMTQIIEHLRALAAAEEPAALQAVDLAAAVDAVLAERDQWLRYRDIAIEWARPEPPVTALAEPAGLRLILVNLLRNAADAVASQGEGRRHLRVTVSPGPALAVHDSGPGIAPDHLPRLFDPFFSTKGGPARGVGLSLAQASARRMGGELSVASALGAGSTFTLRLRGADATEPRS